jgi:hypothetical protein
MERAVCTRGTVACLDGRLLSSVRSQLFLSSQQHCGTYAHLITTFSQHLAGNLLDKKPDHTAVHTVHLVCFLDTSHLLLPRALVRPHAVPRCDAVAAVGSCVLPPEHTRHQRSLFLSAFCRLTPNVLPLHCSLSFSSSAPCRAYTLANVHAAV